MTPAALPLLEALDQLIRAAAGSGHPEAAELLLQSADRIEAGAAEAQSAGTRAGDWLADALRARALRARTLSAIVGPAPFGTLERLPRKDQTP